MLGVLYTLMICAAAAGVGDFIVRCVTLRITTIERIAVSTVLGLGILAYGILAVGLLGFLKLGMTLLTVAFAILGVAGYREMWLGLLLTVRPKEPAPPFVLWATVFGIGAFLAVTLVGTLTPATSIEWDTLAYHFAVPKLYLAADAIYPIDYIHHSNFPSVGEMLYTWGLYFGGQASAKAFHWALCACMVLAVGGFALRHCGWTAWSLASLSLCATPMVLWEAGTGYVDLMAGCLCGLAAFAVYDELSNFWNFPINEPHTSPFVLAGLLGGMATGIKATAMLIPVLLGVAVFARLRRWPSLALKSSALVVVIAIAIASPWFIKTYIYTGNPVYPFFYSVFGGRNWNADNAAQYTEEQQSFGVGETLEERRSFGSFFRLPMELGAWTPYVSPFIGQTGGFTNRGTPFANVGALWGCLALACAFLRVPRSAAFLLIVGLGYTGAWFFLSQQARYLALLLPLLAAAFGLIAAAEKRWVRVSCGALVAVQALVTMLVYVPALFWPQASLLGVPEREYVQRTDPQVARVADAINALPRRARVLLIGEVRGFYLDREYMWGDPGHHRLIPYERLTSPRLLVDHLRASGFTHVLMMSGPQPYPDWRQLFSAAVNVGELSVVVDDGEAGFVLAEIPQRSRSDGSP